MKKAILLILAALLVPVSADADSNTGGVRGFVRESLLNNHNVGAAPVAGATVSLWDGFTQTTIKTDSRGFYVVFGLAPGLYEITADNGAYTTDPWVSWRDVCVHAGNVENVNLLVVPRLVADYEYSGAIRKRYWARFQPSQTQTADVYSIGDC